MTSSRKVQAPRRPETPRSPAAAAANAAGLPDDAEPQQFRVLRAIPIGGGNKLMPGEIVDTADWPFHRVKQLTKQGYLLPLVS